MGISFAEKDTIEDNIEVIEWDFPSSDKSKIQTSKEEILKQVLSGLNLMNKCLRTNYKLSKIYYVPAEDGSDLIYRDHIRSLIEHN